MSLDSRPEALPHFRRRASDPTLAAGTIGVLVHTGGVDGGAGSPRWALRGCFRVPRSEGGGEAQSVLQRIVISLTDESTHEVQARLAFREALVFPEDVREEGAFVAGDFHVDLLRVFEFKLGVPEETYFVAASIGVNVSPIIRCSCHMPWLAVAPEAYPVAGGSGEQADEGADEESNDEPPDDADDDRSWMISDPF